MNSLSNTPRPTPSLLVNSPDDLRVSTTRISAVSIHITKFCFCLFSGELPEGWDHDLPANNFEGPALATRQTSQAVLLKLADRLPELFGGSADLNPSTLTYLKSSKDFQKHSPEGRNIRYGVREHAMAAISNGIAAYGGHLAFCSTFLNFIGYAWGAVIVGALTGYVPSVLLMMTWVNMHS